MECSALLQRRADSAKVNIYVLYVNICIVRSMLHHNIMLEMVMLIIIIITMNTMKGFAYNNVYK